LPISNGRGAIKTYGDYPFVSIGIENEKNEDLQNKMPLNRGSITITLFLYNTSKSY
jgi:hypothetical protein